MWKLACQIFALLFWMSAQAAPTPPLGQLPETVRPTAYKLDFTLDPAKARFSGHTQIEAVVTEPTSSIYLHGNDLTVAAATVTASGKKIAARYSQVDESGVVRLDLPQPIQAGKVTLSFDYLAGFRTGAEGLFRAQVGSDWYAWTQLEATDARRVFPGFDEPRFKTPFTVTVTAPAAAKVFANAPQIEATRSGAMTVHRFAATKPLPTYLVALGVGPFDVLETAVPPNAVRATPLPLRVIATKGQIERMRFAAAEGPKLVSLLEAYFGLAYPFEKLDLMASPNQPGAMENAGLIISNDYLLLLDSHASRRQLRDFGDVSAHEMAHQWFGDWVTPSWWTDTWLNESFAEWMGKKISHQWRPDLGIAATELEEAFNAMSFDALPQGRPIHQVITDNRQITSAFDSITYEKGAQVLSMFESYLGRERFAAGVSSYLRHYGLGNATADDFFRSLAQSAGDPDVVPAMRTFVDQTGVPLIRITEGDQQSTVTQQRYRPLGVSAQSPQTWSVPLCMSRGMARSCTLLKRPSATLTSIKGTDALLPNAGGTGYYRFSLDAAGWDRLIAAAPTLPERDALAVADSLWGDFVAGTGSFARVAAGARALSQNAGHLAAVELAKRLSDLARTALTPEQVPGYRKLMESIYAPRLAELGLNLRTGAYAGQSDSRSALRESLAPIVALEAREPSVRARLAAAVADLSGGAQGIDPAFRRTALAVSVQDKGAPFMRQLAQALINSSDPAFRGDAVSAIAAADTAELAQTALELAYSPGMQAVETIRILFILPAQPGARGTVLEFADAHFDKVLASLPGIGRSDFPFLLSRNCSAGDEARIDTYMKPKLKALGGGVLELDQTKERVRLCAALRAAKGGEISTVLGH